MFNLFGKKQGHLLTGIVTGEGGMAVASIKRQGREQPRLQSCNFSEVSGASTESLAGLLSNT
ncbi:MAG: hypothetical protein WBO34_00065, partial [Gammaproteobacteria bacterium]